MVHSRVHALRKHHLNCVGCLDDCDIDRLAVRRAEYSEHIVGGVLSARRASDSEPYPHEVTPSPQVRNNRIEATVTAGTTAATYTQFCYRKVHVVVDYDQLIKRYAVATHERSNRLARSVHEGGGHRQHDSLPIQSHLGYEGSLLGSLESPPVTLGQMLDNLGPDICGCDGGYGNL